MEGKKIYMKKYIIKFLPESIFTWFLGFFVSALQIGMAYIGIYILNAVISLDFQLFFRYTVLLLIGWCITYLINYIFEIVRAKTVQKIIIGIRTDIAEKIEKCSYNDYHKENSSIYLSWMENDIKTIEANGLVSIFYMVMHTATILSSFIALLLINRIIAGAAFCGSLILLLLPKLFEKMIAKSTIKLSTKMQTFVSKIQDVLLGFDVLFSFNKRSIIKKTVYDISQERAISTVDLTKKYLISTITVTFFTAVFQTAILGLTGFLAINQIVTIGTIMATSKISTDLSKAMSSVFDLILKIKSVKAIFKKFETLKVESKSNLKLPSFKKEIELKNVSFSYNEGKTNILSDLNMKFEIGKKCGLIGKSGSGKTTILKLLSGMLENFNGSINYDGNNITDLNQNVLRENMAYIDQNVYIFNKTIKENICLEGNFSQEQIDNAVKNSALEDVIAGFENGINTMAEENGKNFSGGQRQRIAIARALIHGRKILLIDEGTSSLDLKNSIEIEKKLIENPELTVIMISHHFDPEIKEKLDYVYTL